MAQLTYHGVSKIYQDGTRAVNALNLDITDGEFMVLVGPSGCGKTTALRMAGGLEQISEGEITIGGRVANQLGPRERDVAMVFQNYALYPHMSVFDNIAFPPRRSREARSRSGYSAPPACSGWRNSCGGGRGTCPEGSASGSPWDGR